jgi:hypothetical protein
MSTHVCAIFDRDQLYARRLAGALSARRDLPFYIRLFTEKEALMKYLGAESPEILLIGENSLDDDIRRACKGQLLPLLEEPGMKTDPQEAEKTGIFKYQRFSNIVRQLMGSCGQNFLSGGEIRIFGFYSFLPAEITSCLAALAAWYLGPGCEKCTEKALYLNLDEFSSLIPLLPAVSGQTISDALYSYQQNEPSYGRLLPSMAGENVWFRYLAPFVCAEDCARMDAGEMPGFLHTTAADLGCRAVVLDIGQAFPRAWELFSVCETVFIPEDEFSSVRLNSLVNYLVSSGREELCERLVRFPAESCRFSPGCFESPPAPHLMDCIPEPVRRIRERDPAVRLES